MPVPTSAVRQWAEWMGRPDYMFDSRSGLELSGFSKLTQPLLAFGFSDDDLAPQANIEHLLTHFPHAKITREWIDPKNLGQGPVRHAGFFKTRFRETLWQRTADWLCPGVPPTCRKDGEGIEPSSTDSREMGEG
jgi:predicted alpha/beta hydrolase